MFAVNANNQGSQTPERNYCEREVQGKQREQLLQKKKSFTKKKLLKSISSGFWGDWESTDANKQT